MGNIVKLVFQAIATGSGFGKLLGEVKGLNEKMPGLSKAAQIVGMSFGTAGAAAGRMVSMLLQGGIWGVAAEGAKLLIDQLGIFKDRSAETKEKLDKLEESTRKFYETINSNSQNSIEKIDAETKRRNEQLDITNRMIKAELQLQKARAISTGDTKGAESIDRQMAQADQDNAMQKALGMERDAVSKVKAAESGLVSAQKAEREANAELARAESALASASKPITTIMQSSAGAFVQTQSRDTSSEKAAVESARKRLELAEQATDVARKSVDSEREKWKVASANVKALKAEQEAADAEMRAKKASEEMSAIKKQRDENEKLQKELADKEYKAKIDAEEKKKNEAKKKLVEELQEEIRQNNERRKKELQKDIEANRKRSDDLRQKLEKAEEEAKKARDVLGNAAGMDQAGALSDKRRAALTDDRYTNASIDLVAGDKIRKGADGKWESTGGRLSNFNQAVMDRMNAEAEKRKLEGENDKVVKKLDELIQKLEQMSTL